MHPLFNHSFIPPSPLFDIPSRNGPRTVPQYIPQLRIIKLAAIMHNSIYWASSIISNSSHMIFLITITSASLWKSRLHLYLKPREG